MSIYIYPPYQVTVETGSLATSTKQDEQTAILNELNDKLASSLVPEVYDYVAITYVPSGDGIGEIQTVTYKTGGSGGSTVALLTLAYDSDDKLASVTRS